MISILINQGDVSLATALSQARALLNSSDRSTIASVTVLDQHNTTLFDCTMYYDAKGAIVEEYNPVGHELKIMRTEGVDTRL